MANSIEEVSYDGKFYMVLKAAMNVPGVQIKRSDFLRKELSKYFDKPIVDLAIEKNPASAGISTDQIEKIAISCIKYETNKVTAISVVTGIPGGFAMLGTVPADTAQYFAHIVRILQKLIYLYGWKEIYNSNGDFDDETESQLTLFIGVMFGVNAANAAVAKLAHSAALKVEKSLANKALTKGLIYPIVKKTAERLGVKMTKEIFAKGVGKVVPVVGGAISGGLTYLTFKPLAVRLKNYLKGLPTADVNFCKQDKYYIDIEFDDIIDIE
ncbi:MAG: membrane protein [Peptococcaceae bacterium BRH_c8a]|nr:MAG: membrane protein [Peptococcaceae bacterium BRH_c8a]